MGLFAKATREFRELRFGRAAKLQPKSKAGKLQAHLFAIGVAKDMGLLLALIPKRKRMLDHYMTVPLLNSH